MIVLASQSPRRRELLERAGISFVDQVAMLGQGVQGLHIERTAQNRLPYWAGWDWSGLRGNILQPQAGA